MSDVENRSYLMNGGIWTELQRRKGFARLASIKKLLSEHLTRTLYNHARAEMLKLIERKIAYKERLTSKFDSEFTDTLHRQLTTVTDEVNTLMNFVMSFDEMAAFHENETAQFADQWFVHDRRNMMLNMLLDAQTERAAEWGNTAMDLHDHVLNLKQQIDYAA